MCFNVLFTLEPNVLITLSTSSYFYRDVYIYGTIAIDDHNKLILPAVSTILSTKLKL
jgi:hypothetical protein